MKDTINIEQRVNIRQIVVIAEYMKNAVRPITDELIECANQLSTITGDTVTVININGVNHLESENYKSCLLKVIQEINPSFILMGHTSQGVDVAPGLAARLDCTCITGVNRILKNYNPPKPVSQKVVEEQALETGDHEKGILFSRSVFKGKLNAVVALENTENNAKMTLLTIQPGSFAVIDSSDMQVNSYEVNLGKESDSISDKIEYGDMVQPRSGKSKLDQAKIIVAAGRGIGDRENIGHIKNLAACFTDAAVAGSRPLIDMGWMPYEQQVGITGALVSPDLYMAVGISGSSQHIAGMKDSKFIVAVNRDPNAAIFNVSDICIVEESLNFIETFTGILGK